MRVAPPAWQWLLALLLGGPLALCAPTSVAAEEHAPKEHAHAAADAPHGQGHDAEHAGGHGHRIHGDPAKPLLSPGTEFLHISPQLFVWTFVLFLIVWFLLRWSAWGPVLSALATREGKIADAVLQAEAAREEAKELLKRHGEETVKAHEEAKRLLAEARTQAASEAAAALAKAREECAAEQERAMREIKLARSEALGQVRASAADLPALLAGRLIGRELQPEDYRHLVDEEASS